MTDQNVQNAASVPSAEPSSQKPNAFKEEAAQAKQKRTLGLKLFDVLLYPVIANFGVFAISVVATYLTSHGDKIGGKTGKFFFNRGEWFKSKATKVGLNEDQADMAKMVLFSFVDGSLMAPFVKGLEDRREKIARRIDKAFGTLPEDESVYAAEPKQGWGSVLAGRFSTAAIVVPTAVALDKAGLNDKLFSKPGLKAGEKFVAKFPKVQDKHSNIDFPGLFKVGFFEAFYTSVCTAGLYVSSRFIARHTGKKKDEAVKSDALPDAVSEVKAEAQHEEAQPKLAWASRVGKAPQQSWQEKAVAAPEAVLTR